MAELYYLIKKDEILYNSKLIFNNYHTISKLHKKNGNLDAFIKLLKDEYLIYDNKINETCKRCNNKFSKKIGVCPYCREEVKRFHLTQTKCILCKKDIEPNELARCNNCKFYED